MPDVIERSAAASRIPASDWRQASMVLAAVLAIYAATMIGFGHFGTSPVSYFDRLAAAFLHGRTDLVDPPAIADLARYNGRWYVPFPPLPAILMLPAIAVVGVDHFNAGAFIAIEGSIAAAVVFLVLQRLSARGITKLTVTENGWLTGAFAFGSVAWYMSTTSNVWFLAQVSTYCCAMVAVLCVAAGWSPIAAGIALGLAAAGRPHAVAAVPMLMGMHYARGSRLSASWLVQLLSPIAASALALGAFNIARFGSFGDFGYRYALVDSPQDRGFLQYGQFSFHFLPHNVYAWFLELPHWNQAMHFWTPNPDGMSLVLAMPFILWIVKAPTARSALTWAGWLSLLVSLVPPLLYYTSGAVQFSARYFMDGMPAAVVLMALAMRNGLTPAFRAAVVLSVMVNAAGTVWWHWPR